VDIWALGCILYELAIGETAFSGDFGVREYTWTKNLNVPLPKYIKEEVQIPLRNLIRQMLHINPRRRPTSDGLQRLFEILNKKGSTAFTSEMEDPLLSKICQPLLSEDDIEEIHRYRN
jgi:serine/threonine protein kinase